MPSGGRIPQATQRQALTVTLIGVGAVVLATLAITAQSGFPLSRTFRADNVQRNADRLTHVVEADGTDDEAMRQLGVGEFGRAVGSGTDLEASILPTSVLAGLEVPTSGPRRSPCPTAVSWSGLAPTTSSFPSTTWDAGSPTW